jgi:uncharacterized repeat protein (TIGR03803 family)
VYKLDLAGHETVLHSFSGRDGAEPSNGIIGDSAGNLYGTTVGGGSTGSGVVYKLDVTGNYTILYSFTGGPDGGSPEAGVIRDSAGNLYGTTYNGGIAPPASPRGFGVLFKLDNAGHYTVLHTFTGGSDGGNPSGSLIPDSAGNLYGTTANGGPANAGVVYRVKPQ